MNGGSESEHSRESDKDKMSDKDSDSTSTTQATAKLSATNDGHDEMPDDQEAPRKRGKSGKSAEPM